MFLFSDYIINKFKRFSYNRYETEYAKEHSTVFKDIIKPWNAEHIIVRVNGKVIFDSHNNVSMPNHLLKTIKMYFAYIEQNYDIVLNEAVLIANDSQRKTEIHKAMVDLSSERKITKRMNKIRMKYNNLFGIIINNGVMCLSFSQEMKSLQLEA